MNDLEDDFSLIHVQVGGEGLQDHAVEGYSITALLFDGNATIIIHSLTMRHNTTMNLQLPSIV